jgi:hypothetical protein
MKKIDYVVKTLFKITFYEIDLSGSLNTTTVIMMKGLNLCFLFKFRYN